MGTKGVTLIVVTVLAMVSAVWFFSNWETTSQQLVRTTYERELARDKLIIANQQLADLREKLEASKQENVETYKRLSEVRSNEYQIFRANITDDKPTWESARYAINMFDENMDMYEREAAKGNYFYRGNLGDVALPMLRHTVLAYNKGLVNRDVIAPRLERLKNYVRPDDATSLRVLKDLAKGADVVN